LSKEKKDKHGSTPKTINVDFELGMVNLLREEFRKVEIKGCRFHLGQAWYRKNQSLGIAQDYSDCERIPGHC
jgi:hypothetical protein